MTSKTDNLDPACSEIRERIPLFIGGDLDLEVLDSVSEHLRGCSACRRVMESAKRGREALVATLRQHEPDYRAPGLWAGVRAGLLASGALGDAMATDARNTDTAPALPSRRPVLVDPDPAMGDPAHLHALASPLASHGRRVDRSLLLRRGSAWVALAAAACALFFLLPFSGGDDLRSPGRVDVPAAPLAGERSGPVQIEALPVAPANVQLAGGTGAGGETPAEHRPLRKLQPGDERLFDELRRGPRVQLPQGSARPGGSQLAGYDGYQ